MIQRAAPAAAGIRLCGGGVAGAAESLVVRAHVRRGSFELDIDLAARDGETVALVGPSGIGKTTALRLVAGLLAAERGSVWLGGVLVDDPAQGVFVPPERRSVGWVPQHLALFEHLDATANVAFGLRSRGVGRARATALAREWLERFGLAARARSRVADLSGGEAQRVALARALATEPQVILLDEPLSALDPATRHGMRSWLREHLADQPGTRLMVTHDPADAAALADRVVGVGEWG